MSAGKTAFALMLVAELAFMGYAFVHNLPTWCAHPERPGNSYVQPLCSR